MSKCEKLKDEKFPTETYRVRNESGSTLIFMRVEGKGGVFSMVGPFGNYSTTFNHFGQSYGESSPDIMRRYLAGLPDEALVFQLTKKRGTLFDKEATIQHITEEINILKKNKDITAEEARELKTHLPLLEECETEYEFMDTMSTRTPLMNQVFLWNFDTVAKHKPDPAIVAMIENAWSPLREVFKSESPNPDVEEIETLMMSI